MGNSSTLVGACLVLSYFLVLPTIMATFECYTYDSEKGGVPTVVGGCQACINVTLPRYGVYPYRTKFTQGCSPDIEKNLGCIPVDDQGSMCTCDSEKCNGDGKPYPTKPPQLRAFRLRSDTSA